MGKHWETDQTVNWFDHQQQKNSVGFNCPDYGAASTRFIRWVYMGTFVERFNEYSCNDDE